MAAERELYAILLVQAQARNVTMEYLQDKIAVGAKVQFGGVAQVVGTDY
jgi:hypothetical protein